MLTIEKVIALIVIIISLTSILITYKSKKTRENNYVNIPIEVEFQIPDDFKRIVGLQISSNSSRLYILNKTGKIVYINQLVSNEKININDFNLINKGATNANNK